MTRFLTIWCKRLKVLLIGLFSLAQALPAGAAVAPGDDGEFLIVMCTPEGAKTVSWEEATGEPSPFAPRSHDDGNSQDPCHACATGACAGGKLKLADILLPNVFLMTPVTVIDITPPVFDRIVAGPPMPSRAPPKP